MLVETDRQPIQLPSAAIGELERRIAAHVDAFIPDRATLQVGFGAIPEAIIAMLGNRRDLGVHSGMVGDSLVELVERGVVTNAAKGMDEGVSITGVLFGTDEKLYRFAHRNPALKLCPVTYTHAFDVLSRLRASSRSTPRSRSTSPARSTPRASAATTSARSAARSTSFAPPAARRAARRSSPCRARPRAARCRASSPG